jgi:uncharacterized damage-inducible protein DinB
MRKIQMSLPVILLLLTGAAEMHAQQSPSPATTELASSANDSIVSQLNQQLSFVEAEVMGAAKAMPEEKYSFVPATGEYKGVRNFGQQAVHIASANYLLYGAIVPDDPTAAAQRQAAASAKTKEQILEYLQESFAFAHKAIAAIDAKTMTKPVTHPPNPFAATPLELAVFGCSHGTDIYGQMVEYLRLNGIVPPFTASRPGRGTAQSSR